MEPYYQDAQVSLYLGDCREVLPALGLHADVVITDPPYGETDLEWDVWPAGWPTVAAAVSNAMWCCGSLRMFLRYRDEFDGWKLSQDVVWAKNTAVGRATDRFRRAHEQVALWYRGDWGDVHKEPVRHASGLPNVGVREHRVKPVKDVIADYGASTWVDDGTRLMTSVIYAANMHRRSENATAKPVPLLAPLVSYSCPPGGVVCDPFAGGGPALVAAKLSGRRAVGIELRESQCDKAARRLQQGVLAEFGPPPAPVPAPPPTSPLF